MRNLGPCPKGVALRNCCAVHCRVGARVTATWTTRLEFTSMMKNAKTGRNQIEASPFDGGASADAGRPALVRGWLRP